MGRGLECRLRAQLLEKLPNLEDRYVSGRPTSDFTARAHALHVLRGLPELVAHTGRSALTLVVTAAAIAWIHPSSGILAALAGLAAVLVPLVIRRFVTEQSLRLQTHAGALGRFYLDALKGLSPIRAHGAERAMTREHEGLLVEWAKTGHSLHGTLAGARALQGFFTMAIAVALVVNFVVRGGDERLLLLVVYWALRLPQSGQELAGQLGAYPGLRNVAARLFEPLGAPEIAGAGEPRAARRADSPRGVHIELRGVTARAMGHTVLRRIHLAIEAGEHIAIVGSSGAGKSSLIAMLLGWIDPSEGDIRIDGELLGGAAQASLRERTAWVDPAVHLWSRSLFDNVMYGAGPGAVAELPRALRASDLEEVLERTPGSLQAVLGEGGTNVSGGQGQRVRFARAAMRRNADLVLLDEAFRGLDRDRRRVMLARARKMWQASTLLLVTHDVSDALHFDRVLVVDGGRIVEDGVPAHLARKDGKFRELLDAEVQTRKGVWGGPHWQRVRIEGGRVVATEGLEVPR
jgi:ATP-binding cassette subfamily B protein